jgi:hypothetical protein
MGRLDNIIARNRRPNRMHERLIVSMIFGVVVLLIIALAVFTDLGRPPEAGDAGDAPAARDAPAAGAAPGSRATGGHGKRVDGVLLRTPPRPPPAPAH